MSYKTAARSQCNTQKKKGDGDRVGLVHRDITLPHTMVNFMYYVLHNCCYLGTFSCKICFVIINLLMMVLLQLLMLTRPVGHSRCHLYPSCPVINHNKYRVEI